jgi:putative nucleotidyltransferase with HDIG domain
MGLSMEKIIDLAMGKIGVLPQNMAGLMQILNDPLAGFEDLASIVNQDPKLATQTLHLCNSAYYAFPVEIVSVSHAVKLVGLKTVAGLAMAAYFQGLMEPEGTPGHLWLRGAKNHVMTTAHLAEYMARRIRDKESPGTAFTGGLLHDIGKLVFAQLPSEQVKAVSCFIKEQGLSLLQAERAALGTDHAEIGCRLAELWDVPTMIKDAICYHHAPMQGQYALTLLVHVSNGLAHYLELGTSCGESSQIASEVLDELHLTQQDALTLAKDWLARRDAQQSQPALATTHKGEQDDVT